MEFSRRSPELRAALPSRGSNARCHGKWVKHHACWIQVKSPVPQENQGQGHRKLNIERTGLGDIWINHFVVAVTKYHDQKQLRRGRAFVSFCFRGDTVHQSLTTGVRGWPGLQEVNWSHATHTWRKERGLKREPCYKTSKPVPSHELPLARLCLKGSITFLNSDTNWEPSI